MEMEMEEMEDDDDGSGGDGGDDYAKDSSAASTARILFSSNSHIYLANYDGSRFTTTLNASVPNTDHSWMIFEEPNLLYALNDIGTNVFLYHLDVDGNKVTKVTDKQGSGGVVHLEANKARTRMLGAGYGSGKIDAWNIENGDLKFIKSIRSTGQLGPNGDRQDAPHPHQSVNDPTGRYFTVNDLGTDSILLIDSQNDAFNIVNTVKVQPAGAGPRHGIFYPQGVDKATHYFLLCEMGNLINVYSVQYDQSGKGITFTPQQTISSYGSAPVPQGATAGEIVISPDNKDVYVSDRLTGKTSDLIAHLKIHDDGAGKVNLEFVNTVPSGGVSPRMFSVSTDGGHLFVANENGANKVAAIVRGPDGAIDASFHGTIAGGAFGQGPQYIKQIR
ncbi:putative 6-phosphogluconolactonase [Cladobotryum mycophilum]|uniref:6-phosphogluconolactonase n=1 Tax=Cladobotryum mycophilum TaxID=491253 RepID=A0ABR0SJW4_9HYPO